MSSKDGGAAFPSKGKKNIARSELYGPMATGSEIIDVVNTGMTLRDYFAAKAMQGMIGDFDFNTFAQDPLRLARWSYQAADAMLKAREENAD